jgi:hypothetical protein
MLLRHYKLQGTKHPGIYLIELFPRTVNVVILRIGLNLSSVYELPIAEKPWIIDVECWYYTHCPCTLILCLKSVTTVHWPGLTWILDISVPGHFGTDLDISVLGTGHFSTDLDISVLGTGQFGTWMRQYSVLTTIVWYLLIVNIFILVVL